MEKIPTYEQLLARVAALEVENRRISDDIQRKSERIAYLERLLFGSKRDRLARRGPGLFDQPFDEAYSEKAAAIEKTAKEIEAQARQRRQRARRHKPLPQHRVRRKIQGLRLHLPKTPHQGRDRLHRVGQIGKKGRCKQVATS